MSFGSVFAWIAGAYGAYYLGNIAYDLNKKPKEEGVKTEEEEVDIEDIAGKVIQTQEINKDSLSDYMPSLDGSDIEGDIMSDAICKIEEVLKMFKENPDHPDNPLRLSNIAYWVTDE